MCQILVGTLERSDNNMQNLLNISVELNKIILKYPKLMLFSNVGFWFVVGISLSYLLDVIPLFKEVEFFKNYLGLASVLALVVGYFGGLVILMRIPEQENCRKINRNEIIWLKKYHYN